MICKAPDNIEIQYNPYLYPFRINSIMRLSLSFAILVITIGYAFCQGAEIRKKHYNIKKNIAMEGYDPVSYFERNPIAGKENITMAYNGITYQFASQANLAKFKAAPGQYEPAYGGWCAYAMGESGEKVKVDPETYTILDGKLYLFYNFWGNNTLKDWEKNEKRLKEAGDLNWKRILQ